MARMLIVTDNSPSAVDAARLGASLAGGRDTEVIVMSVAETPARPGDKPTLDENAAAAAVAGAAEIIEEAGLECRTLVAHGSPAASVPDAAETLDVDLIVMGRRGLDWLQRRRKGSVSDKIASEAVRSVLLVAETAAPGGAALDCVLAAVDGSADARTAAEFAADIASQQKARAVVLHVVPATGSAIPEQTVESVDDLVVEDEESRRALEEAAGIFEARDVAVEIVVRHGLVHVCVLEAAEASGAGLVAVGHRGVGEMKRMLLGSVSDRIVHNTTLPVLLGCAPKNGS